MSVLQPETGTGSLMHSQHPPSPALPLGVFFLSCFLLNSAWVGRLDCFQSEDFGILEAAVVKAAFFFVLFWEPLALKEEEEEELVIPSSIKCTTSNLSLSKKVSY